MLAFAILFFGLAAIYISGVVLVRSYKNKFTDNNTASDIPENPVELAYLTGGIKNALNLVIIYLVKQGVFLQSKQRDKLKVMKKLHEEDRFSPHPASVYASVQKQLVAYFGRVIDLDTLLGDREVKADLQKSLEPFISIKEGSEDLFPLEVTQALHYYRFLAFVLGGTLITFCALASAGFWAGFLMLVVGAATLWVLKGVMELPLLTPKGEALVENAKEHANKNKSDLMYFYAAHGQDAYKKDYSHLSD